MNTVRRYGDGPYRIAILHGGPGAAGEAKPVAEALSADFGVLELLQTEKSVSGQIEELYQQLSSNAELPAVLVGHSWGAWLAFLFASRYPKLVKKLILVGAGSFENRYNRDLMKIRLERLDMQKRREVEALMAHIRLGSYDDNVLKQFGELMTVADSYDYLSDSTDEVALNMEIHSLVWREAAQLRDTNELISCADKIECPVVAFHGDYDPHPIAGVEKPLSKRLREFKMIRLSKCGHTPWKERCAKDEFYRLLKDELQ
jgi:Predicted hydrolases or acyltransferases (alpha/beta hydrolase superfamily)